MVRDGCGPSGPTIVLLSRAAQPACSAFASTNFGGYVVLGRDLRGDKPLRAVADWGVMANVDARNAVGASVFASLDQLGLRVGPAVHYRRWLSSTASVDVALGAPLLTATDHLASGSVFGLVRWSPNHGFAAPLGKCPLPRYLAAVALGRFPRLLLIAGSGAVLRIPLVWLLFASGVIMLAGLSWRHLRRVTVGATEGHAVASLPHGRVATCCEPAPVQSCPQAGSALWRTRSVARYLR